MKKIFLVIISILVILVVVLFLIFRPVAVSIVVTENYNFTDKAYLTADTTQGALTIEMHLELPTTYQNQKTLDKIQTIIRTELFGDSFANLPNDTLMQSFAYVLKDEYIQNNLDFADKISDNNRLVFNNSFLLEGFALLNDEHIFSYGISRFVDFGGTHPTKTRFFYNFNLSSGDVIHEQDLFQVGYMTELAAIIRKKIMEDNQNMEELPDKVQVDEMTFSYESIKPNGNFYINDVGICYVFNPYEIAPYYIGETEVILPYQLISHLMKTDNPVNYLVTAALNKQ